jgi:hypothetical protein
VPTAKSVWFISVIVPCKTIDNTEAPSVARAIALDQVGSREGMGSCLPTTGPGRFFGAADEVLGKIKPRWQKQKAFPS